MSQCATRGYDKDPFLVKSSRTLERKILEDTGLVPDHVLPYGPLPLPLDHKEPQLRRTGRNEAHRAAHEKRRLLRFTMAAAGGLLLVVPVIIMSTVPGLISSLVTTCVSTLIFAFLVAWRTDFGPNEVLATTAAYAAVLVVFVGTSLSPRTNSS
jgi:VIT1/CCC1 family predicted Fe2+/Mn2+ transporter